MREGLEGLSIGRPTILHRATIVVSVLIDIIGIIEMLLAEGVAEREVCRIPWHGILHRLDVKLEARDGEILGRALSDGIVHDAVLLVLGLTDLYSIIQLNILVHGVVLGCRLLVAIGIIDRSMQFDLFGNKSSQVGLNGDVVLVIVVQAPVGEALVNSSESFGLLMESHVERRDITHIECHRGLGCPSALAIKVGYTQLINPDDAALGRRRVVANADEHHAHLAQ